MVIILTGLAALFLIFWGVSKLRGHSKITDAENQLTELDLEETALDLQGKVVEKKIGLQTKEKQLNKRKGKLENEN